MNKCPKNYTIPTDKWLVPLNILVDEYNLDNDNRIIYDAKLIENEIKKERVIVKVVKKNSFTDSNNTESKYFFVKESHHVAKTYCFINCRENKTSLTNNYKDMIGFCNGNHHDKDNQLITLEIMRKYESSLKKYESSLNLKTVIHFTKYLLLVQLELFNKYGFVHNDIHLGNILIKKEKSTINFNYKDNNIKLDTDIKLYLTDFEYSLILFYSINPKIKQFLKDINNRNYDYTLEKNIYNTFYCCLELLEDEKMKTKLHHLLTRGKIDDYSIEKYHDKTKRSLDEYSSGRRPENNFITITNIHANEIISALFKLLFQQSFL
jgi:hypothetical protein